VAEKALQGVVNFDAEVADICILDNLFKFLDFQIWSYTDKVDSLDHVI
jgi:hypothetical protein